MLALPSWFVAQILMIRVLSSVLTKTKPAKITGCCFMSAAYSGPPTWVLPSPT